MCSTVSVCGIHEGLWVLRMFQTQSMTKLMCCNQIQVESWSERQKSYVNSPRHCQIHHTEKQILLKSSHLTIRYELLRQKTKTKKNPTALYFTMSTGCTSGSTQSTTSTLIHSRMTTIRCLEPNVYVTGLLLTILQSHQTSIP